MEKPGLRKVFSQKYFMGRFENLKARVEWCVDSDGNYFERNQAYSP